MNVEYTGRQYEITPANRKQVDAGLAKLSKIIGTNCECKVILGMEKHRSIAEITVASRNRAQIVGVAEAADMISAIGGALERIERQALKNKGRWRNLKRQPKEKGWTEESQPETMQMAVGATAKTAVAVAVHTFPPVSHTTQAHITKSQDALALRPMRLEEAIKECEFRDRDVFIFRDPKNQLKVLHRKRDGKLELIEVP